MTTEETIAQFERYVIGNYTRTPVVFVRGEGSTLWDADGNEYLDLFPGWGVNQLGHCPPRVIAAIREQAGKLMHVANNYYMEPQGQLACMLSERAFGGRCFFCNSGAEANEAALKLARLATPAGRYKVITFENSFHGRTFGALSATGQPKYHHGLEPLLPGFMIAPFNDPDAVEKLIDEETAAVLVEPIQGEGGINVASRPFLSGLRALCDRHGLLLILDEVQTGCGRLGEWFGHQIYDVTPDIMTLAKGLGGGAAIGAMMARPEVAQHLVPGTHAATFGGNPLACAAAIAAIETIEEDNLLENVKNLGDLALDRMVAMKSRFPAIREVRGMGGMLGLELDRPGADVVRKCMERRVLINCTHDSVLRMLPAMNATPEQMERGLDVIEQALEEALS